MNITCIIDNLAAGGAQRQMCMLAILLREKGHKVTILTYHPQNFFLDEILQAGITYQCYQEKNPLLRIIKFWKIFQEKI